MIDQIGRMRRLLEAIAVLEEFRKQATSLVIENRTSEPDMLVDGQIWLRIDL